MMHFVQGHVIENRTKKGKKNKASFTLSRYNGYVRTITICKRIWDKE
jgi:hypothetical protein